MNRIPWNKGKKHSEETKTKMKLARVGRKPALGKKWKIKDTTNYSLSQIGEKNHRWGKKASDETRRKMGIARSGERNPNWRGGVTAKNEQDRKSKKYKQWRKFVFERDNWTCVLCNRNGGDMNADHIKKFSDYPELRFDVSNGRTLCVACHKKVTSQQQTELNNKIDHETGNKKSQVWSGLRWKNNSSGENRSTSQVERHAG